MMEPGDSHPMKHNGSDWDFEQQRLRAEMAKEMAELKRGKAEEARQKKEEILAKVAAANLREAEKRAELAELELEAKKKQLQQQQHEHQSQHHVMQ